MENSDEFYMKRAITLARKAIGRTCPNPLVGAVIVKDSKIVGEGYHKRAGMPHAEIEAINAVRDPSLLYGATMYVNLEPCNHFGKTPPCSVAIYKSGIKRVVIGMRDVNEVARGGVEFLRSRGIEVKVGVLEDEARKLNEVFIENVTKKKPFFVMKAAMLLNGSITLKGGVSKWITSEASRRIVHRLRAQYGAVAVGINTVLMDDPLLTCRLKGYRQPKRLVFDANLRIPVSSNIFSQYTKNVYVITSKEADQSRKSVLRAMNINVIECSTKNGEFEPQELCERLLENEVCACMIEGGSRTHGYFIRHRLYNKAHLFYAPGIAGSYGAFNVVGSDAPGDFGGVSFLKDIKCRIIDDRDILVEGYF